MNLSTRTTDRCSALAKRASLLVPTGLAVLIGFAGGVHAAQERSGWQRVGEYGAGAGHRCVGQQATVVTPPGNVNAYGGVRFRHNDGGSCNKNYPAPLGYMGVTEWLQRGNGKICAARGYVYSKPAGIVEMAVPTGQGQGNCNTWSTLRSIAQGRIYKPASSAYSTAPDAVISPWAS